MMRHRIFHVLMPGFMETTYFLIYVYYKIKALYRQQDTIIFIEIPEIVKFIVNEKSSKGFYCLEFTRYQMDNINVSNFFFFLF